jgi:hypothetical protein
MLYVVQTKTGIATILALFLPQAEINKLVGRHKVSVDFYGKAAITKDN